MLLVVAADVSLRFELVAQVVQGVWLAVRVCAERGACGCDQVVPVVERGDESPTEGRICAECAKG